jgi:KDO2-lipid IV(A) lauroyltransferase
MRRHILDHPISYRAIFISVRCLPLRICYGLGRFVALIVYAFSRRDRRNFALNLSLALNRPAGDPILRRTIRRIFLNYAEYMVDFFRMPQLPPRKVRNFFTDFSGIEKLHRALERGQGAILLSAHVGNWEFGGTIIRLANYPLAVVAMAHNTSKTNELVNKLRHSRGIQAVELDHSPFSGLKLLRILRRNGVVAMVGDKDFFGNGIPVDFFDRKVRFPIGPVILAMKSGAALIPAFVLKRGDGKYFGVIEEPIPIRTHGEREEIIMENLGRIARVFEKYIRRYPDQWYCPDPILDHS